MTSQVHEPFDGAAIDAALKGTWSYPDKGEPTGIGYVHFTNDGRTIQFVYAAEQPEKRIPLRHWYSVESPSTLRLRLKDNSEGWTCEFRIDGSRLHITNPQQCFPCIRVSSSEIPEWFCDALAQRLSRP